VPKIIEFHRCIQPLQAKLKGGIILVGPPCMCGSAVWVPIPLSSLVWWGSYLTENTECTATHYINIIIKIAFTMVASEVISLPSWLPNPMKVIIIITGVLYTVTCHCIEVLTAEHFSACGITLGN